METAGSCEAERTEERPDIPDAIPFLTGEFLKLKSIENPSLKAQTPIVGVFQKDIIFVEKPMFKADDRIDGRVGGGIICVYFRDGWLYRFKSRLGQILIHDIVCIDYPKKFEAKQLRADPRIKVLLEALAAIGKERSLIHCNVLDVSKGGCCLALPSLIELVSGIPIELTFMLPTDDFIENIKCTVMNMCHESEANRTIVGLSFSELDPSIKKFCEMCSYFSV